MKVAIISSDRVNEDGQFGQADRFLIYELGGVEPRLVEERSCQPIYVDDATYPPRHDRFDHVLNTLMDCQKIFVSHIGRTPAARLRVSGIEPVIYQGPIARIAL